MSTHRRFRTPEERFPTKVATTIFGVSTAIIVAHHLRKAFLRTDDTTIKTYETKNETKENAIWGSTEMESNKLSIPLNIPPKYDNNGCVIELSQSQWHQFYENGFVKIGKTMSSNELATLRQRMTDIMLGKIQYNDKLLMQLDPSFGDSNQLYFQNKVYAKGQTVGFKGATLNYRKIGETGAGLECDPLYRNFMTKPIFKQICKRIYGNHAQIGVYRAMVFNKPAKKSENNNNNGNDNDKSGGGGTRLPWHQDGGHWWALDRDPQIFVWTALYPSNKQTGGVKAIKKSFKLGILSEEGHMLAENDVKKYCQNNNDEYKIVDLITNPGESWLVHNWTIHSSGTNKTNMPRWAFSCNYIDGRTRVLDPKPSDSGPLGKPGQKFHVLFDAFEE